MLGRPIDAAALQQAIMAANDSINRQRLHASAFRIAFVAAQVVPRYKDGERPDTATLTLLADLTVSAEDIDRKSVGEGKSVSDRVDLGGHRYSKKKKQII